MKDRWAVNFLKNKKDKDFRIKLYIFIVIAHIVAIFLLAVGVIFFILISIGVI